MKISAPFSGLLIGTPDDGVAERVSSRVVCKEAPVSSSHANGWGGCVQQFIDDEITRAPTVCLNIFTCLPTPLIHVRSLDEVVGGQGRSNREFVRVQGRLNGIEGKMWGMFTWVVKRLVLVRSTPVATCLLQTNAVYLSKGEHQYQTIDSASARPSLTIPSAPRLVLDTTLLCFSPSESIPSSYHPSLSLQQPTSSSSNLASRYCRATSAMSGSYDVDYDSDCDVYDYDDDYIYADAGAYDLAVCRFDPS